MYLENYLLKEKHRKRQLKGAGGNPPIDRTPFKKPLYKKTAVKFN